MRCFGPHIVDVHRYIGILFPRLGVFVGNLFRIKRFAVVLQAVRAHIALVGRYVRKLGTLIVPRHQVGYGKFLLVHPIGGAVDDFIFRSARGYGHFASVVQFFEVQIVIPHKGDHPSVGAEHRFPHFTLCITQRRDALRSGIVHKQIRIEGTAVDALQMGVEQYFLARRCHRVAFDPLYLVAPASAVQIHHYGKFLACLVAF